MARSYPKRQNWRCILVYFGSHERIFPLEKTNIHRPLKKKGGRVEEGGRRLPHIWSLAVRDVNRKLLFVLCFVLFM